MLTTEWPPAYIVKRHWRARHVKMTYSSRGLEITIPCRFSLKHLPDILEENKVWIQTQRHLYQPPPAFVRPDHIHILAFQQNWSVHYFQYDEKRPRVKAVSADGLILSGDMKDEMICRRKLSDWVRKHANVLLIPYFRALSESLQLPYLEVTVRSQTTLWGSCSQDKSIRLNYKLLFLPEHMMRHIMIHELCHTRHMNHSEKFWQLVAKCDSDWIANKKAMKGADKYMPAWLI
jgi:predicted metal-dependent hydrolase